MAYTLPPLPYPHEALEGEKKRRQFEHADNSRKPPPAKGRLKLLFDHSDALIIVNGYALAASTAASAIAANVAPPSSMVRADSVCQLA